jgi:hypothetical protein
MDLRHQCLQALCCWLVRAERGCCRHRLHQHCWGGCALSQAGDLVQGWWPLE